MADSERLARVRARYRQLYRREPRVFQAPGRVNLIGEHTDYNDGFVLPVAIDRNVLFAASDRPDRLMRLYSLNLDSHSELDLDSTADWHEGQRAWSNYVRGVAYHLRESGQRLVGMDVALEGNVPVGSGLSSSAALEVASATAMLALSGGKMSLVDRALLCQRSENQFVGVNCGIMDMYISTLGKKDHALLIDCRSLEYKLVPLVGSGYRVVVANTMVRRGLAGSEYNVRRRQCEEAVATLSKVLRRPLKALRDVTLAELEDNKTALTEINYRRARHVVGENERTLRSVDALRVGDLEGFGRLMVESHESLRDLYEVSSVELDAIVETSLDVPGVYGARMTGAGFGGCAVALVREEAIDQYQAEVGRKYSARTGREAQFYICQVVDGAGEVTD